MNFRNKASSAVLATLVLSLAFSLSSIAAPKAEWADSPLPVEVQSQLERAGRYMKSGKYDKAKPIVLSALNSASDVPKCLAIAQYTEPYAFPMLDLRRQCCNKALSLCTTEDDYLLMALRARKYQFFEVTREAISKLIENARTVPQLYTLAKKAQEVSLNDLCHLAMEKAAQGFKTRDDVFAYCENCKALGLEDLLRKGLKLLIDEEDDSVGLCELALKIQRYGMRDQIRYALRKALDHTSSDLTTATGEMTQIVDAARRLNEPDVKDRAEFYMKKGNFMLKQKGMADEAERRARGDRERQSLDEARIRDKDREASGFSPEQRQSQPATPVNPSSGY
ncbi:MAG: hypothetical protein K2X27_11365 [Candidatus Obscuribacterales bacterium]|nr:hypothetical protein [Candidatus Obscuribacterales bacterium]